MNGVSLPEGAALVFLLAMLTLVVGVAAAGFLLLARAARSLAAEEGALRSIRDQAAAVAGDGEARREAAERLEAAFDTAQPAGATVAGARVRALGSGRRWGAAPDREVLLAAAEARLREPLRFPRWVANVLVLCGLAGTLLGLTLAVWGLSGFDPVATSAAQTNAAVPGDSAAAADPVAVQTRRVDELFTAVEATLGGMQTAFVPALLAVALTIVLLLALSRAEARGARLVESLETLTDEVLLPLFHPEPSHHLRDASEAALAAAHELRRAAADASRTLATAAEGSSQALAGSGASAAAAVREACDASAVSAARSTAAAQQAAADSVAALRSYVAATLRGARAAVRRVDGGAAAVAARLEGAAGRAVAGVDAAAARHDQAAGAAAERLVAPTDRLLGVLERAEASVSRVAEATELGGQAAARVSAAGELLERALGQIAARLESQERVAGVVAETSGRLADAFRDLEETRRGVREMVAAQQSWSREIAGQLSRQAALTAGAVEQTARLAEAIERRHSDFLDTVQRITVVDTGEREHRLLEALTTLLAEQRQGEEERLRRTLDLVAERLREAARTPHPLPVPHPGTSANGSATAGRGGVMDRIRRAIRRPLR